MSESPSQRLSSIDPATGKRRELKPYPVAGRFLKIRTVLFFALMFLFWGLPWIKVSGYPLVWLDIPGRRFWLGPITANAQDFYLFFFVLSGLLFGMVIVTALWGRIWCGYICPQTVFLEGVFRRLEEYLDGPLGQQRKRQWDGLAPVALWRRVIKYVLYAFVCITMAWGLQAYIYTGPGLIQAWLELDKHPIMMGWFCFLTTVFYLNFVWFREQMCLIVCPYGKIQSVLTDKDTLVVGFDTKRGEPYGKPGQAGSGDCIDCHRCVDVCPTGIDIRQGWQLECLGCAQCIDACDAVMAKLKRPLGLIRYDSQRGLDQGVRHFLRPRLVLYAILLLCGAVVATTYFRGRLPFEANWIRSSNPPYFVNDGYIHNVWKLHVFNKSRETQKYKVEIVGHAQLEVLGLSDEVSEQAWESQTIPLILRVPEAEFSPFEIQVHVTEISSGLTKKQNLIFMGPNSPNLSFPKKT